jgi:hypothetical protein
MRVYFCLVLSIFLLSACGNGPNPPIKDIAKVDSPPKLDSARIFSMPAPLQVATWFHQHKQNPEISLLADFSSGLHCETEYSRSLCLGVLLTDIGYLSMYNQRQLALDKISMAEQLMKDLHLDNTIGPILPRLKKNIDQPDSISFLVLKLYDESGKSLNAGGRESSALYITSGSYLESLALTLSSEEIKSIDGFNQLVGQQKIWLDNLAEAVTYLPEGKDSQDLYSTFFTLQHYFEPIKVNMSHNLPYAFFSQEQLAPLKGKAVQLRNDLLK